MRKGKKVPVEKRYCYITDLSVKKKNAAEITEAGRKRWKIENEGFNTQKRQGFNLEHLYSRNYQAVKNHYYLIQIGHMISQVMEAWEKLWKGISQGREQKHRRILESFQETRLREKTNFYNGNNMDKILSVKAVSTIFSLHYFLNRL